METWLYNSSGEWELLETWYYNGTAWESLQFNEYARLAEVWDQEATTTSGTPPTVTLNPINQSVLTGGSVTFTAAANGTAPITWTWHKNGGSAISGAGGTGSTSTYTIPAVTEADAGSYTAKATNAYTGTPVVTSAAVLTVSTPTGSGLASIGANGLVLLGSPGAYAETLHASAIQNTTALDAIVIATSDDWSAYWGNDGGTVQALIGKSNGGTDNFRCWDLAVTQAGRLITNLSADGEHWAPLVASNTTLVDGATYAFRVTWQKSNGATALYAAQLTSVNDTYPATWNPGAEAADPVATGTKLTGQNLLSNTANLHIGATNANGVSAPLKGTIHYAELRTTVGGSPVWSCDFRIVTVADTEFPDDTGARSIYVRNPAGTADYPVGMPNGEAANVGLTATIGTHTGITYASLDSQQITKVITTAMANAEATTEVIDGTTYHVFDHLNVTVAVKVTSTTPVLIKDSKIGQIIVGDGADVQVHWCDIGFGYARTGDEDFTDPTVVYDGTDTTNPTSASWNFATSLGSGGDTITVDSGAFTDTCLRVAGATNTTKLRAYRCNLWGHTDAAFIGGTIGGGNTNSLSEFIAEECWWHDYLWFPRDGARINKSPNNAHCDGMKINACAKVQWIKCRFDMWPNTVDELQDLTGPAWKGAHWGVNPFNRTDWPLQRSDLPGNIFVGIAYIISNQAGGNSKNVLVSDCTFDGPIGNFFQFGDNTGQGIQQDITIRRNRFLNGVASTSPQPWIQPRSGVLVGGNPSAGDDWNWPVTGPDVNIGINGATMPEPKAGMNDSSDWTPS